MNPQSGFSRRAFLGVAAAGAAVGAAALVGRARLDAADYPVSPWPEFSDRVAAVLSRLGALWLPVSGAAFPRPPDLPFMDSLAASWGALPDGLRAQVNQATEALEVAALVYGWHGQVFSRLSDDDAHAYLRRWAEGAIAQRALIAAYRQLVAMSYWRHPQTWPATGYSGPLHLRTELPALGDAPEPQRA